MAALTFPHCCIKTLLYDHKDETLVYITKTGNRHYNKRCRINTINSKALKKTFQNDTSVICSLSLANNMEASFFKTVI